MPASPACREPTEVSTSVTIYTLKDLEEDVGWGLTMCETIVRNSMNLNARKINFVIVSFSHAAPVRGVYRYGYYNGWNETKIFAEWGSIARFQTGLQRCFKYAVDSGEGLGFRVLGSTVYCCGNIWRA